MPSDLDIFARDDLTVSLAGRTYAVAWRSASSWCALLRSPSTLAGACLEGADRELVTRQIMTDDIALGELQDAGRQLLERVSGWRWWEAERLVSTSASRGIYGELALSGVDPERVSLAQWLAATYALLSRNRDTIGMMKLDAMISVPPRGYEDEWDTGGDNPEEIEAMMSKLMGG